MKPIREKKSLQGLSAFVVLSPEGVEVAVVHVHSSGGRTTANVWNHGQGNPSAKEHPFQAKSATGYGYNRTAEALRGMIIHGHQIAGECEVNLPLPEGLNYFPENHPIPAGFRFANRCRDHREGFDSCIKIAGLDYLAAFGFRVIQAF